ncbi:MAG: cellulase family glycosylhydrolase [Gaiellaceae bacterium]
MRRATAALLALGVAGVALTVLVLMRHGEEPRPPATAPTPAEPRLLVGFFDDASFRWRPYRADALDQVQGTGARIVRVLIRWHLTAPVRPRAGRPPFRVPMLYEIDELVANASARGMTVLFSIWGTPSWANRGRGPNYSPSDPDDLRRFARGLAYRYPTVQRYAVWNEPNTEQFLAPQFDADGHSVAPLAYARLYRAAYDGIKEANPQALVAIGETSSHGRDAPSRGRVQDSHSPARFARLLAAERPRLEFDAWGHHPYPVKGDHAPDRVSYWPSVTMSSLDRFGRELDRWFDRPETPMWITEYAYEATPAEPYGVAPALQATFAARALDLAAAHERVRLFVWFTFRDDHTNAWQSGLLDERGRHRPAYAQFAAAIGRVGALTPGG